MSVSCSDCGKVMRDRDHWTVVAEEGFILSRLCPSCFDRYVAGITMPWDRIPEPPVSWQEAYRCYRMAVSVRSVWDREVFVDGTLYRWSGSSPEPGEITDMDGMGAGFRKAGESIERHIMRHAVWAPRHRKELQEST